jgi:hypothetical protein
MTGSLWAMGNRDLSLRDVVGSLEATSRCLARNRIRDERCVLIR